MKDHIAGSLSIFLLNSSTEKLYEKVSQIYILGNFLTISAIPVSPERGNVLVTEQFRLDELSSVLIRFN